ncbi:MAG: class F sortase [Anaerolineaceae bacterium]|nr:class F sortase [Anaerolineaceae bacterium]
MKILKKIIVLCCLILSVIGVLSAHAQEIPSPDRPEDTQTAGTVNITWSPSNHRCKGAEVQAVVTVEEIDPDVETIELTIKYESCTLIYLGQEFDEGWSVTVEPKSTEDPSVKIVIQKVGEGSQGTIYFQVKPNPTSYTASLSGSVGLGGNSSGTQLPLDLNIQTLYVNQDGSGLARLETNQELPQTGFSAALPQVLSGMPMNLSYKPLNWTLEIPTLSVQSEIVEVPYTAGGYPIAWLGDKAGLLEGFDMPGEGMTLLTGHNNLNADEIGPFAFLKWLQEGDRIFIHDPEENTLTYIVYANEKIAAADVEALEQFVSRFDNSLTLMTCEDEVYNGGFASRRIIAAKPVSF